MLPRLPRRLAEILGKLDRLPGDIRTFQVSRSDDFDANVIEDLERRKPSARLGIRGEGTFYWRVAAYRPGGSLGPWSETRSFQIGWRG